MDEEDVSSQHSTAVLIVLPVILFLVFLFLSNKFVRDNFGLPGMGETGDFINGLAAPIISLASALLIYFSFRMQVRANRIQMTALQEEINHRKQSEIFHGYKERINEIKRDLEGVTYVNPRTANFEFTGMQALEVLSRDFREQGAISMMNNENALLKLQSIMIQTTNLFRELRKVESENSIHKQIFAELKHLYAFKIAHNVNTLLEANERLIEKNEKVESLRKYRDYAFKVTGVEDYLRYLGQAEVTE